MISTKKFSLLFISDTAILLFLLVYNFTNIFAVRTNYQVHNLVNQNATGSGGLSDYITSYTHPFFLYLMVAFIAMYVLTFVYGYYHIKK